VGNSVVRASRRRAHDPYPDHLLERGCVMRRIIRRTSVVLAVVLSLATVVTLVASPSWASTWWHHRHHHHGDNHTVTMPDTDKLGRFQLRIRAGDTVTWVNSDTDDHSVVSDDAFNTAGPTGVNEVVPGTDNNNGHDGVFTLEFDHAGTFVYYCKFHAMLDPD